MNLHARRPVLWGYGIGIVAGVMMLASSPASAAATVVYDVNFDSGIPSNVVVGGQSGGAVSLSRDSSQNYAGSGGALKGTYPRASGATYGWAVFDMSKLRTNDVYVEFWAKMPAAKQGLKFLKIFGGSSGGGYSNTTFALDYTGGDNGSMYQVSFGDGTPTANDTGNVINFSGANPNWIGRSYGKANVQTPQKRAFRSSDWGTSWHHFRFHVKYNSGSTAQNEVNDGEYYVEIDGKVYVDAKGLFNRHYSNPPIDRIELFGWAQSGDQPFEIWYDSVRISTGGFVDGGGSTPAPKAPDGFVVN